MTFTLKQADIQAYLARISNYSFTVTMVIVLAFFTTLNFIKQVTQNHALAESLSPISLGMSLLWNFFFFAINFQFAMNLDRENMQYLALPAFWYFVYSFTFESRLFILAWRAQLTQQQLYDQQFQRKMLTWFYILFYVAVFTAVVFQNVLIYRTWAIMLFNSSIWLPQIIHSYRLRSRRGPPLQMAISLSAVQSFLPLYVKVIDGNFLDQEADPLGAFFILAFLGLQVFVLAS